MLGIEVEVLGREEIHGQRLYARWRPPREGRSACGCSRCWVNRSAARLPRAPPRRARDLVVIFCSTAEVIAVARDRIGDQAFGALGFVPTPIACGVVEGLRRERRPAKRTQAGGPS